MTDQNEGSRADSLRNGIRGTKGLRLPIRIVARLEEKEGYVMSEELLSPIKTMCIERIREQATNNSLLDYPDCQQFLYFWGEWAGSFDEPKQWVKQCSQSDEQLIPILKVFASHFYASDAPGSGRIDYYDLDSLERYMPADELENRLNALNPEEVSAEEQWCIDLFYADYKAKQAGEPYGRDRMYD